MKKRYILLFVIVLFGITAFILVVSAPTETTAPTTQNPGDFLGPQPAPAAEHDLIRVTAPKAGQKISSPLSITGQARGNWYFEASFPITLTDAEGNIIAQKYATAQGEWMTTDFVPFEGTLEFTVPAGVTRGYLILQKDNPSGEARFDDQIELPVTF